MKTRILHLLLLSMLLVSLSNYAASQQTVKPGNDIKEMFENETYQELVDKYSGTPRILSAEELSYVAHAYIQIDDLNNAIKYADLAIQKDRQYSRGYYVKGIANSIQGKYKDAVQNLEKAIELSPKESIYHTELGDVYYAQELFDKALLHYRKAIRMPNPSEKAFFMISSVHTERDETKAALDTFYVAKSKIKKDKELLVNTLYNIGKLEYDSNEFKNAAAAYQELTEYFPDDYYSLEKQVECFNSLGNYAKAEQSKKKLYEAYAEGKLAATSLYDKFCVDRMSVGLHEVVGYERFEAPTCQPMTKNLFYVSDADGKIIYTISFEYIPAIEENSKGYFEAVKEENGKRQTLGILLPEDVQYSTLQSCIKDIVAAKDK